MDIQYGERQFYEIKQYTLAEGKANGVRCVDVDLGELSYTLIADRSLDIGGVKYRGKQIAFLSKNGVVSPSYYDLNGYGWLNSFGGGLFVTCGLQNAGDPCEFNGKSHGLHGRISHIPAERVNIQQETRSGEKYVMVSGIVRETRLMDCDYELRRTVTSKVGGNSVVLSDRIKNRSDIPQPLMLLYHINFGYPLIGPETVLEVSGSVGIEPFDEAAEKGLAAWDRFSPPSPGVPEEVFLHDMSQTRDGRGFFSIINRAHTPELGVDVRFSADTLPYLGLWKSLRTGEYAVALEPCNNHIRGVAWEYEYGNLRRLWPGEEVHTAIEFEFR